MSDTSDLRDDAPLDIRAALDSFALLGEGWDSYGGAAITPAAIAAGKRLWVSPTSAGGVEFEWEPADQCCVIFTVTPEGTLGGFYVNAHGNEFEWERDIDGAGCVVTPGNGEQAP